jgi:TonB family protein
MGLWEFLRQWQRSRLVLGALASLLVHVILAWSVLWGLQGEVRRPWMPKRGDTIIVELPRPDEPGSAGSPTAPPPARPPAPAPPRATVKPPAPPATPAPREQRRVAVAPRPAEPRAPAPPEPTRPVEPAPAAPDPAPRAPDPAPRAEEPSARAPEPAPSTPAPAAPAPPAESAPSPAAPPREGGESQVAALPPRGPSAPSVNDVRAALRRGAAGQGQGRGGIEGDPVPLDSEDTRYSDYLEQVRRRIQEKWGYPCVRRPGGECQGHTTSLEVEFGILKDGRLQFVELIRAADHTLYDEYAMNAIRLAQPFPPVPAAMMAAMRPGSTGIPIRARFIYVSETSLTKFLR